MVLVFAAIILFVQYWFSDKIALFGMHGHLVTPEQAPQLHGAIDRLCALADMKKPRVAIADTDVPNAFATGRSPNSAVVCATTGLMRRLDEPELEAVLAHELSHVAHRDVAVMTIASFLGMVAGMITRIMLWSGLMGGFGGGNRNNNQGGDNAALVELAVLVVSVVVYAISFLLTMALSRYRELAADRSGRPADRPPVGTGLGPGQGDRRHGPHPHPRPAVGRELQRLLLHAGHRQERGQPVDASSPPIRRWTSGWPSWPPSRPSSDAPRDRPSCRRGADPATLMGLLNTILGRTKPVQSNLDALFALPSASITLQSAAGMSCSGHGGVCFKPPTGQGFEDMQAEVVKLLSMDGSGGLRKAEDSYGYHWLVVEDADIEELVTRIHMVNSVAVGRRLGATAAVLGLRVGRAAAARRRRRRARRCRADGRPGHRRPLDRLPRLPVQAGDVLPVRPRRPRDSGTPSRSSN